LALSWVACGDLDQLLQLLPDDTLDQVLQFRSAQG
jgi:hypothetical protein